MRARWRSWIPCPLPALASLLLAAAALSGCTRARAPLPRTPIPELGDRIVAEVQKVNPWTNLRVSNDPENFHFALLADRTGSPRPGVFEEGIRKLNLLDPEFVLCVGDLIEGKTEDVAQLDAEWAEALRILSALEMPLFLVPGNHDIANEVMARKWEELFGRTYYHFTYRGVLFLVLNTEDGQKGHIGPAQAAAAARALAANKSARWTFVFLHQPLWLDKKPTGWQDVEALLGKRRYTVFAGHDHAYMMYNRNGRQYIKVATTGGSSSLAGPATGELDEVVWVTLTPKGPRIANLALDGILEEDFLTEDTAALGAAMRGGGFLEPDPLFVDGGSFEGRPIRLRLVNSADQPLKVRAAFQAHEVIDPAPKTIDRTVPPRSTETVPVRLETRGAWALPEVPPLELKWSAAYEVAGRPALTARGSQWLVPEQVLPCPRRQAPVLVDGRLDEWPDLPRVCQEPAQIRGDATTWQGPQDGAFRFAVGYDERFFYIAIEATDERLVLDPKKSVWDQDGLEVRVDARPDPGRSAGRGKNEFQDFLLVALSPGARPEEMVRFDPARWPKGTQAACVKNDKGYSAEIAVPVAYLDEKQGGPWKEFRLNIAMDDFDSPTDKGSQLWWRPDWRTKATYAGSGTFRRQ